MRLILLLLALAGCTTMTAPSAEMAALDRELAGRQPGAPARCVVVSSGTSLDIVSSDTLVYRRAGTIWVNRLESTCPGLRRLNQLLIEPAQSGRYCRNDRVRGIDPGASGTGPVCRLGTFTPHSR